MSATKTLPTESADPSLADNASIQLVTFRVHDVMLAIDIEHVQEINRLMDVTPVPEASSMIHGVVNLRGDVVTVINPHRVFDLPEDGDRSAGRNLILNIRGERIGVLVDSVSDILTVSRDELSARPQNVRAIDRRFIQSVYLRSEDLVVVLDPVGLVDTIND
ncbi:MAG: chemotaxis protein CheW [Planctomycetota bacterium]